MKLPQSAAEQIFNDPVLQKIVGAGIVKSEPGQRRIEVHYLTTTLDSVNGDTLNYSTTVNQHSAKIDRRILCSAHAPTNQIDELNRYGVETETYVNNVLVNESTNMILTDICKTLRTISTEIQTPRTKYQRVIRYIRTVLNLSNTTFKFTKFSTEFNRILHRYFNERAYHSRNEFNKYIIVSSGIIEDLYNMQSFVYEENGQISSELHTIVGYIGDIYVILDRTLKPDDKTVILGYSTKQITNGSLLLVYDPESVDIDKTFGGVMNLNARYSIESVGNIADNYKYFTYKIMRKPWYVKYAKRIVQKWE